MMITAIVCVSCVRACLKNRMDENLFQGAKFKIAKTYVRACEKTLKLSKHLSFLHFIVPVYLQM